MARMTRSAAAREAALLAAETQPSPSLTFQTPEAESSPKPIKRVHINASAGQSLKKQKTNATTATRRVFTPADMYPGSPASPLPHNLGSVIPLSPTSSDRKTPLKKTDKSESAIKKEGINRLDKTGKKSKKTNQYGLTPGVTPFPDWVHPTPEECKEVNRLLSTVHGDVIPPATIPEPSLTVTGCGEVPSVLDALIRTLLSGATTGTNSALAFNGLVQRFGILTEGIGKGSVNWDAVRKASLKDVFEAIKRGGLADVKSKKIKGILDMVYAENQERREMLVKGSQDVPANLLTKPESGKQYEIACADQNFLSLNHLHGLPTDDAMAELVKYPGIGPKTAGCVLLFCLQRPCFAVDTHIFRICKWLNWVPPDKAKEITAYRHLEVRIPDHLKYSLHQLFIRHGKSCPRCRAITGQSSAGWDKGCVIDHLVNRTGRRKAKIAEEKDGGGRNGRQRRS